MWASPSEVPFSGTSPFLPPPIPTAWDQVDLPFFVLGSRATWGGGGAMLGEVGSAEGTGGGGGVPRVIPTELGKGSG